MQTDNDKRKKFTPRNIALTTFIVVVGVGLIIWWGHVDVVPPPPKDENRAPSSFPLSQSHLSLVVTVPRASLAAQLDKVVPHDFAFDVKGNPRVFGKPGRGQITVACDLPGKRVTASTPVGGRIQVEGPVDVLFIHGRYSVGIDASGTINATISPLPTKLWTIDPRLALSARVNRAVAHAGLLGDKDVTGLAQGQLDKIIGGLTNTVAAHLANYLNLRSEVDRVWKSINGPHKLADDPPTWLRITPRKAEAVPVRYTTESVVTGMGLDAEGQVFIQRDKPETLNAPLPDLDTKGTPSNRVDLVIPIAVSYEVLNTQLAAALSTNPVELTRNTWVQITNATLQPYGDGVLLKVAFHGKKGLFKSASGWLYIVGLTHFDPGQSELRLDQLKYTTATDDVLLKSAEWIAHSKLLNAMQERAVVNLTADIESARAQANQELEKLAHNLPKEIGAEVKIDTLTVRRLQFTQERAYALVSATGTMSVRLEK
ncbi:MAG TPA: DUF4403 family protein [Planctomycetaceae bacterium]|jgi:hypothetical protein|nr:DUF4403 family protein [Planctomycetaceae bacterium]